MENGHGVAFADPVRMEWSGRGDVYGPLRVLQRQFGRIADGDVQRDFSAELSDDFGGRVGGPSDRAASVQPPGEP